LGNGQSLIYFTDFWFSTEKAEGGVGVKIQLLLRFLSGGLKERASAQEKHPEQEIDPLTTLRGMERVMGLRILGFLLGLFKLATIRRRNTGSLR